MDAFELINQCCTLWDKMSKEGKLHFGQVRLRFSKGEPKRELIQLRFVNFYLKF